MIILDILSKPEIKAADLAPLLPDTQVTSGPIHAVMYQMLILYNYLIADLRTARS